MRLDIDETDDPLVESREQGRPVEELGEADRVRAGNGDVVAAEGSTMCKVLGPALTIVALPVLRLYAAWRGA